MCLLYLVTVYVIGSNKVYLNLNLRGEYSFDSGETESADEDMATVGEPVGERQRGGGSSGGHGGNRQGGGDPEYRRAGREEEVNRGGVWVVVGDSILRPGDIRDGLGAKIRGAGVRVVEVSVVRMGDIGELVREEVSRVRQEGGTVDGIIIHAGTNDFGRGTNVCEMVRRATAMAGQVEGVAGVEGWGGGRLYWSVMLPRAKEGDGRDDGKEGLGNNCTWGHLEEEGHGGGGGGGGVRYVSLFVCNIYQEGSRKNGEKRVGDWDRRCEDSGTRICRWHRAVWGIRNWVVTFARDYLAGIR